MSIAKTVQALIDSRPFLAEGLIRGLINYNNLADDLCPEVERIEGGGVKTSAVAMALRRYAERLRTRSEQVGRDERLSCQIRLQSHICDFSLRKSPEVLFVLGELSQKLSREATEKADAVDFFELVVGHDELSLCISIAAAPMLQSALKEQDILAFTKDLVAITMTFSGDFFTTPGIIFQSTRLLAWEHINVYEVISTQNELTFIVMASEAPRALEVLQCMNMEMNS